MQARPNRLSLVQESHGPDRLVFRGVQHGSLETQAPTGAEFAPGWNYTIRVGYRMLFDVFR